MTRWISYVITLLCLLTDVAESTLISPAFGCCSCRGGAHGLNAGYRQHGNRRSIALSAGAGSDGSEKTGNSARSARERGIYARPSAAIERGSGFFIPGLEGSRIRFIFGITVILADAANHVLVGGRPGDWGQVFAESLAAFYGAFLLLQGSIEIGVENKAVQGEGTVSAENEDKSISNKLGGEIVSDSLQGDQTSTELIQRMARTIITFTPATCFQFANEDLGVLYSSGVNSDEAVGIDFDDQQKLVKLCLDAVSESRGGRVALPSDHPASKLLPQSATRCILVQKITGYKGSQACMIIGSDKLLPSFTKNDLRWIGQLAEYHELKGKKI
ncbi:hypothetical protein ACHAWF_013237 [Thalassiosira exigua]